MKSAGPPYSVMIYCGDVLGLGHMRRNTAIASRLVQECPGSNVLLLTSLPAGHLFESPEGVDAIKLPSLRKAADGSVAPSRLSLKCDELRRIRANLIQSVAESFRPDLLLVDHLPTGVWGELLPILRTLRSQAMPPAAVLGLRDIIDEPRATVRRWQRQGVYRDIDAYYDDVLVYGAREVFDTGERYRLEARLKTGVRHCGYVCADGAPGRRPASRRELGLGKGPVIVITAGAGADGFPMMRQCLDGLRRLEPRSDLEVVCITGPLMSRTEIDDLRRHAADLPVRVLWCVERAALYFETADLIVTMAGYNTLVEAVRLGKRALVLPRPGPSAEQRLRAELFARRGLVRCVDEDQRAPEALAAVIDESLREKPPATTLPEMDGLERVVRRLRELLDARAAKQSLRQARHGG